jgi:pimeloyl-ACP methyl ester carboxylesterase
MSERYSEQAVLLGRGKSLVGVLARPAGGADSQRPAVIILNTGIVHRVGHHRMYVDMSRQLAAAGHAVLRFDFSGIGDSRGRADGLGPVEAFLADVGDATDWLSASCDADGIVLMGLCSGAEIALRYGHTDPRVVGLALFDPPIPPTTRFYVDYILRRMTRLRSWLTVVRGRGRLWGDLAARIALALGRSPSAGEGSLLDPRARRKLERLYRNSLERDIALLVVLTGGELAARQTYREQLLDAFPGLTFEGGLRLEHFADSDHTFSPPQARERLNAMTLDWLAGTPFRRSATRAVREGRMPVRQQARYAL